MMLGVSPDEAPGAGSGGGGAEPAPGLSAGWDPLTARSAGQGAS
jgi:hypothetical protein